MLRWYEYLAILILAIFLGWLANTYTYPSLDEYDAYGHYIGPDSVRD